MVTSSGDGIYDTFVGQQHECYLHRVVAWLKMRCGGSRDIDVIYCLLLIGGEETWRSRDINIVYCLPMVVGNEMGVETLALSAAYH